MKQLFLFRLFAAIAEAVGGNSTPVLSSPLLTELQAKRKIAWAEARQHEDPDTDAARESNMALLKINGEIKAEQQRLTAEANAAKIAEQRNQRLALNQNQLSAYAKLLALQADKKAKPEDVSAAQAEFDTAKELVDNELLAKYGASKPAAKSADGATADKPTDANKAKIIELFLAGKKHGEIENETGIARSTVWHTINNYKKANNIS